MTTTILNKAAFVATVQNAAYESFGPGQSAPTFPLELLAAAYEYEARCNEDCGTQQVMSKEHIYELFVAESETALDELHKWWKANYPICLEIINSACDRGF